jgi:formamidopyrimidine-DNA glycosylase
MWFELDTKNGTVWLVNRFGLEGEWGFDKYKHSDISMNVGSRTLYFTDQMHYGTLEVLDKTEFDHQVNRLGPDFLKQEFTDQEFYDRISKLLYNKPIRKNWKIIKVLMTQTAVDGLGSGLGNYLSVEALFRARISPHATMQHLLNNRGQANKLAEAIRYTVKWAFSNSNIGYLDHLPEEMATFIKKIRHKNLFLKHTDVGDKQFVFNVYRQKKYKQYDVKAEKIIAGRSCYWVPQLQTFT